MVADDLSRRTGRETAVITGVERPVPLALLLRDHASARDGRGPARAPIRRRSTSCTSPRLAALERAQAMTSINVCTASEKDEIAELIGDFRFTTNFGRTLSRLVRAGIGVHHAGMLPKYRRLVEQLAQRGLLRVICGTDTLGVGHQRSDPHRAAHRAHQVRRDPDAPAERARIPPDRRPGRAGRLRHRRNRRRAGAGSRDRERKALQKAGDDPKKLRKIVRKKAPEGFVSWGEPSFNRLVAAQPETLTSSMRVSHAMLLNVHRTRGRSVPRGPHAARGQPRAAGTGSWALLRQALAIYRTLRTAGIVNQDADGADLPHRRPAAELRAQPAAVTVRARGIRTARSGVAELRPRHGVGARGDPRRSAAGAVRPAVPRPGRGGRRR